jgi:hypothetical protein
MFNRAGERIVAGASEEAAALYTCSYSIVPHPNTLYNLALALEAGGRLPDACSVLELYLLQAPTAINRSDAEALLAELRSHLKRSSGSPPEPPRGLPPLPRDGYTAGSGVGNGGFSGMASAGWILLGTGVALASGGGITCAVLADHEKSLVLHPVEGTPWRDVEQHRDAYNLYSNLDITFFVVGGAAMVVGAVLLLADQGDARESPPAGFPTPLIGPGMAGLGWTGRFDAF